MTTHNHTRLETQGGTVIAYFAPEFEIIGTIDNDLTTNARPRDKPAIVRDQQRIAMEVTAQGAFEHSSELPSAHRSALETLFGSLPVTARDQVGRIREYQNAGPLDSNGLRAESLHFYHGGDEYAYTSPDWFAGQYPPVAIDTFEPVRDPGVSRWTYTIRLAVGDPDGGVS